MNIKSFALQKCLWCITKIYSVYKNKTSSRFNIGILYKQAILHALALSNIYINGGNFVVCFWGSGGLMMKKKKVVWKGG